MIKSIHVDRIAFTDQYITQVDPLELNQDKTKCKFIATVSVNDHKERFESSIVNTTCDDYYKKLCEFVNNILEMTLTKYNK